jgi:hypothetical protein
MRPALGAGDLGREAVVLGAIAMGIERARESIFERRTDPSYRPSGQPGGR